MKDKCTSIEELSAHVDGDLAGDRAKEVAAHIETCAECRLVESQLKGLKAEFAKHRDIGPKRDLWSGIEERLISEPAVTRGPLWWFARLAPVPLAAAAVIAVVMLLGPVEKPAVEPRAAKTEKDLTAALADVEQAEAAYRDAIASLEKALDTEKAGFDPETLAVIEKSLAEIESAIARSREALRKDPGNLDANRAMLAAYRQKMDFLFEVLGPKIRREGA